MHTVVSITGSQGVEVCTPCTQDDALLPPAPRVPPPEPVAPPSPTEPPNPTIPPEPTIPPAPVAPPRPTTPPEPVAPPTPRGAPPALFGAPLTAPPSPTNDDTPPDVEPPVAVFVPPVLSVLVPPEPESEHPESQLSQSKKGIAGAPRRKRRTGLERADAAFWSRVMGPVSP
jgi:hypothetical protein